MPRSILLLLLVISLLLTACRPPDGGSATTTGAAGVEVEFELLGAATIDTVPVRIEIRDQGDPVANAKVELIGDMTHAGMVPVVTTPEMTDPGVYLANDFRFTMAGDWFLTANIELPDGRTATAYQSLSVSR